MTTDIAVPRKFKKRPVEIEAYQLRSGGDIKRAINWINANGGNAAGSDDRILINTLEGTMEGPLGWWVIRGVKGEFYACEPEIFALTYE